jgi:hypothetical protein
MKKTFIVLSLGFLLGCSKDEPTSSTTSNSIAGITLPTSDAGLYTVFSNIEGDEAMQNSAWFGTPNASIDAGDVSYKVGSANKTLTYFNGKYYGIDFIPDSFAVTDWTVAGKNGFPAMTVKDDQKMPIISSFKPDVTKVTSTTSSFRVTNSLVNNADVLIYGLVKLSNQNDNKYFKASSASSLSYTFSNADFKPFIQTNNGVVGIPFTLTALKYKTVTVNGKNVLVVKQYTYWGAVEVQ